MTAAEQLKATGLGRRRAGRGARRVAQQKLDELPLRTVLVCGLIVAVTAVVPLTVGLMLGTADFWLGLLVGACGAVVACVGWWLAIETTGARAGLIGGIAEERTADELDRLGENWTRIDCVPFGQIFDVDHVAVGPTGVFAVETKFTAVPWTLEPPSFELCRAAANAKRKARSIRLMLKAVGDPGATPVLVIWGPGAPEIDGGYRWWDGVMVCEGARASEWRVVLGAGPNVLSDSERDDLIAVIEGHVIRTEAANA